MTTQTNASSSGQGHARRTIVACLKWVVAPAIVLVLVMQWNGRAQEEAAEPPATRAWRAPELEGGLAWYNTDRPLRIHEELKGHVVILDFWTYCCINCMHVLPDLAFLEEKYKNEPFMVVGVHSAKFKNEGERENVRSAMLRYEIKHPVVVDDNMKIWRSYGVQSWPTVGVIDPEGNIYKGVSGEGNREILDRWVGELLAKHRKKGTLAKTPVKVKLEALDAPATGLRFPGKVLADAKSKRLFISDSNHNRIVVTTWPGADGRADLIRVIGDGAVGATDGPPADARFYRPQGMALREQMLYVADTENHLIRRISVEDGSVTTVAGTGKQAHDRTGGRKGRAQGLNSPWDLAADDEWLYIAMAGPHQLWRMSLKDGTCEAFVGDGRETIEDGPFAGAHLAQPSGLALVDDALYFADSEVSAIRVADLAKQEVRTIIGTGLFDFGDIDGAYPDARLQHCLGVTAYGDKLLVADTYNHKIKLVDPAKRTTETFLGTGRPGTGTDGALALYEPAGLHLDGDTLFIADTNNHRIVRVDPKTKRWTTVQISGLGAPREAKER